MKGEIVCLHRNLSSFVDVPWNWPGRVTNRWPGWLGIWGVSESGLRRWMAQADIDDGNKEGLTTSEKEELSRLRRENRVLRMERDLLSRAAAFFASENVLPK